MDVVVARCDESKPFGAPVPLAGIDTLTYYESEIQLTADELTAYFVTNRGPDNGPAEDVFVAHREAVDAAFSTPHSVLDRPSDEDLTTVNISADQLTLLYGGTSLCEGWIVGATGALCQATRANTSVSFKSATEVQVGNGSIFNGGAYVVNGGLTMYFNSHGDGIGVAHRASVHAPFASTAWVTIDGLGSAYETEAPVVTPDERTIFFALSDHHDIWTASRATTDVDFSAPATVPGLSTASVSDSEWPNWISPDGCRLYFTRGVRLDAGYDLDVYVSERGH